VKPAGDTKKIGCAIELRSKTDCLKNEKSEKINTIIYIVINFICIVSLSHIIKFHTVANIFFNLWTRKTIVRIRIFK